MRLRRSEKWHRCAGLLLACGSVLLLLSAAPAYAFTIQRTPFNTVVLTRESTDSTAAASVQVYYDYKGNQALAYWDGLNWNPATGASYNANYSMGAVLTAGVNAGEIPLHQSYAQQCVRVTVGAVSYYFPVWSRSSVATGSVSATVTSMPAVRGAVDATITQMPAVALDSSISVDGTLPVAVAEIGGVDRSGLLALGVMGSLGIGLASAWAFERRGHA